MEISEKQKQKIAKVAKQYQLKLILLFGSRVDGILHEESDYDIAYLPSRKLDFDEEVDINSKFVSIFPQKRGRIDTVDMGRANPLLLFGIFRKSQILFSKDHMIFPVYRAYAFKKYMEIKPFLEKQFKNKLKEYDI